MLGVSMPRPDGASAACPEAACVTSAAPIVFQRLRRAPDVPADRLIVLVVAAVLIAIGAAATMPRAARGAQEGQSGRARALDVAWTIIPLVFLAALVVLAARAGA